MPDEFRAADAHAKLEDRLIVIRARFIAGFDDRVRELIALARAAASAPAAEADTARRALTCGLHTIAGSAPTIGLPLLGERARALEAELVKAERNESRLGSDFIEALANMRSLAREKTK